MNAELYKLNDKYCFAINGGDEHIRCKSIMSEFSDRHGVYPDLTYIKEHGRLIAKGINLVTMTEKMKQIK